MGFLFPGPASLSSSHGLWVPLPPSVALARRERRLVLKNRKPGYFVTGTDTGVGKSVAAAKLLQQLDGDYWKPIQSGLEEEIDTRVVQHLSGLPDSRFHPSTYNLTQPLSPHESARRDGVVIDMTAFVPPTPPRPLIIEGAGGVMVPLNDSAMMVDLMVQLDYPVLLVARSTLGTINHTLLSLALLKNRGVTVAGVILNGPLNAANREAIEQFGQVSVVMEIPHLTPLTPGSLGDFNPPLSLPGHTP
ncbi:MAG: dethiobiotin synthase [Magnetococcales bacterium]|nr:dethiobiotin synthase [Magnetococcales bacterium]